MDDDTARMLRRLLERRPVAALCTLHRGEPAVSMVPFVLPRGGTSLLIHVSALATHTRDMQEHPRVSLLVMAEPDDAMPQALPRVALQADAAMLPREGAAYETARGAYLARFPEAAPMFELGDFSIVTLQPVSARLVAGFGRAYSLVGPALEDWLRA
ncbi:pyridoxamine 5'-phosphate oxidase family protein [Rhizobacter sp. AJA081-3]|uniref:pyridoxamine 5'-phosphate oxidase family protein n=1 Tax=Rhizobacter sp. AJA081-3 TaxID=2753607 RepID=UPI001AE0C822|nr:pyridoxamine 5'-phosphate oxidase family protein [Rhizobacter sp. AJA081-3]QTN23701.1 pyridoxamine 5'-phosphate oxidase family protein [Rhizobacter sp. AJA081-3]